MRAHFSRPKRFSNPFELRTLWKAIDVIRGQRQIANLARVTKVIQRDHPHHIKGILAIILLAIQDNVVIETLTLGCKGSKAGLEQEGYWIPEERDILKLRGTSDSYCFKCHETGILLFCNSCNKVYHERCKNSFLPRKDHKSGLQDTVRDVTSLCRFCCRQKTISTLDLEKKRELNRCLHFIAQRAMEAFPAVASKPSPEDYTHFRYFIWEHQTLNMIADDCIRQKFDSIQAFEIQVNVILHNCVILEGDRSFMAREVMKMVDMCNRELNELELCTNCYLISTTKPSRNWFCIPCDPPHKVVWAKQKGFEYWPAKVIQAVNGKVDVRFFGGHHERAWLTVQSIKCITTSPAELHIKKTKGWTKASEEMKQYLAQTEAILGRVSAKHIVEFEFLSGIGTREKAGIEILEKRGGQTDVHENEIELDSDVPCSSKSILDYVNVITDYDKSTASTIAKSSDPIEKPMHKAMPNFDDGPTCSSRASINGGRVQKYFRRSLPKRKREECNCRRIYARKLFFYQSSVRRMRLRERRNNLMISARFVHQYLKKHSDKFVAIQDENIRLRAENAQLKEDLTASAE